MNCWPTVIVVGPHGKRMIKVTGEGNEKELESVILGSLEYFAEKDIPLNCD